jgi:hypothetical protein
MEFATATLIVNGILSLVGSLPQLVASIQAMVAPEEDKAALIAKVKAAQASVTEWI